MHPPACLVALSCDDQDGTCRRGAPAAHFSLDVHYVAALWAQGACPLILPHPRASPTPGQPGPDWRDNDAALASWAEAALAPAHGLVLTGGDFDVPPAWYGQPPHPLLGRCNTPRSRWERALYAAATRRKLPVLAICGGLQLVCVVEGGALLQDLSLRAAQDEGELQDETQQGREQQDSAQHAREQHGATQQPDARQRNEQQRGKAAVAHVQSAARCEPCHGVAVAPGSLLASALAPSRLSAGEPTSAFSADTRTSAVNSTHHQAVATLPPHLWATAVADDGVVEAIERRRPDDGWLLAVQWHPEAMADATQQGIYRSFVTACRQRQL